MSGGSRTITPGIWPPVDGRPRPRFFEVSDIDDAMI
jgi:hypothetical protein